MKKIFFVVSLAVLAVSLPLHAVTKYTCDFENEADRNRWVLNQTANPSIYAKLTNKWYIGSEGNNGINGQYGLYISDDGGATAHYTNAGCWTIAYDTVTLDKQASAGNYTISFDYRAMGNVASNFDGIYMLWVPVADGVNLNSLATSSGEVPPAYANYVVQLQPLQMIDYVNATFTWKQCVVSLDGALCDGTPHLLAFVWANGANQTQQPGGCIDNIEIVDDRTCDAPTNLKVTIQGSTSIMTWNGSAAEYEVSAYSYEEARWYGPKIVNTTTASFSGITPGQVDFYVRSKCAEDLFSLKLIHSQLVYYPDEMCVDYLNLENAKCYVHNSSPTDTRTFNDFRKVSPVDDGPSQMSSRHTIHYDHSEVEPRTGGKAKTIPNGELASIRLGNWDKNNEAERIEFTFDVDTVQYPVLLLKYMPILEAPGHADGENPRFKLDILIGNHSIGECGQADFNCNDVYAGGSLLPGAAERGWHLTDKGKAQTSADVIWKEWTTVGVNLKKPEYVGKKLTARLTTHDCTFSAHCGYAYFTLGCSDGKLKDMKCGAINPTFIAPDGFNYRWMYASDEAKFRATGDESLVRGHEQVFEAGMHDDSLYVVDCMFVQDSSCYFSLYASTLATNPVSVMKTPQVIKNCREGNYALQLDASDSWVQEIDHVIQDTLVSRIYHIDHYEWNITGDNYAQWSDEVKPIFNIPTTGGTFNISLRTTCGSCDSTIYYTITLDSLGATRDTTSLYVCDKEMIQGYHWAEKPDTVYHQYGMDSVVLYSETTSCDSILYLYMLEPTRIYVDTMVLDTQLPFIFHGRSYTKNTVDTIPSEHCDTAWMLNFEVYAPVQANLLATMDTIVCRGETSWNLEYEITSGRSLRYSYWFSDSTYLPSVRNHDAWQKKGQQTITIPIPEDINPNVYTGILKLHDSLPSWKMELPFTMVVQYASSIIAQRWNDVLAVRNSDYNGGFTFSGYQWYMNGQKLEGETGSYLYRPLEMDKEYQVQLTRVLDGVTLFSCPVTPVQVDAQYDVPTVVSVSASVPMRGQGKATWVNTVGNNCGTQFYNDSPVIAPAQGGIYMLLLQTEHGKSTHRIIVR